MLRRSFVIQWTAQLRCELLASDFYVQISDVPLSKPLQPPLGPLQSEL